MEPLRLGVLGAARITNLALIKPAKITGTRLVAVAARDPKRATAFAKLHGIERMHATWNKIALAAGKHVFTEKPSANNAADAEEVAALAADADGQFFEGFHYIWDPLITRLHAILAAANSVSYSTSNP